MRSIDQLRDKLAAGIPELEAPAIEPLNLKEIRLTRGPAGARLDVNLTDLQVKMQTSFFYFYCQSTIVKDTVIK